MLPRETSFYNARFGFVRQPERRHRCALVRAALSVVFLLVARTEVKAQKDVSDYESGFRPIHIVRPDFHFSLGAHGDFGAGLRLDIPIVPKGVVPSRRDELALSLGLDLQFVDFSEGEDDDGVLLVPHFAGQWNFYLRRGWSVFPELGLAFVIGDDDHDYSRRDSARVHVDGLIAFGARYHFAERMAVLLRAGWPTGLQVGLTI